MISPCDVEMFQIGLIDKDGTLIGKHGRAVNMQHIFGSQYELFREYAYINFYLRPHNRHFFVAPYDMTISELSLSRGRPYMPWIM
jgi:phosphatidylserine decarboxylase